MGIISKEHMQETAWRWRCKVLRTFNDKSLSDYSDISASDPSAKHVDGGRAAKGKPAQSTSKDAKDAFGGAVVAKTMYEGASFGGGIYNWQDYPPRQPSKSVTKNQDRVAIKIFKIKDRSKPVINGRFALVHHRLDIQNPLLVAAMTPILREHEDTFLDPDEPASFERPFRPLYFCYDRFVARLHALQPQTSDKDKDAQLLPYLRLLICVLDEVFAEVRDKRRSLADRGLISFEHAWTYFRRHAVVRSHGHNSDVLSRVVDTALVKTATSETLVVRVQVLRFNGEAFVWFWQSLKIARFEGNRPVVEFDHCPLEFLPAGEQVALRTRLAARGRLVLNCQALTYRQYTGVGIVDKGGGKVEKHNVDGRVLVDIVGYNKHHLAQGVREGKDPQSAKHTVTGTGRQPESAGQAMSVEAAEAAEDRAERRAAARVEGGGEHGGKTDKDDSPADFGKIRRLSEEDQSRNKAVMLATPEDLMFMSPMVEGYALKNKLWFSFYVEDLRPIKWNDTAFDHLVYDEQQKDLVMSFVESHGHSTSKVDDVIMEKGDGLIILLSGPPGTGETLTAEAVADRTHRPLFYLQAEDLGINAAALGANVKKVFEMATEWDAVILLDEADVFMAERHPQDIARNELVSIFLRELEYFRGIIFLTTNLYDTIDQAFRSRVSLHLLFRPLAADARLSVWRKFLARVEGHALKALAAGASRGVEMADGAVGAGDSADAGTKIARGLSEEDLVELAAWNLNGREIKTAVKMVTSWCAHKGHAITLERIENGIRVTSPRASKTTQADNDLYE